MLPLPTSFGKFLRSVPDRPEDDDIETGVLHREPEQTSPEAHIAWMAGAPYARVRDPERDEARFVSLLVPFY